MRKVEPVGPIPFDKWVKQKPKKSFEQELKSKLNPKEKSNESGKAKAPKGR